jgi:hypothetical protein
MNLTSRITRSPAALCLLVLLGALALWSEARAEGITVGMHVGSAHFPDNGKVNNVNPGLYIRGESGAVFGFYRNSLRRTSVYAGYSHAGCHQRLPTQGWRWAHQGRHWATAGAGGGWAHGVRRDAAPCTHPGLTR